MTLSDQYHRFPLAEIRVARESRQRSSVKTADLESSIKRVGVLQPIIIDREMNLIAGERRWQASQNLNLPDIPCRFADELTEIEMAIIELEENVKRHDLSWQDIVRAAGRIHKLFREQDPKWTQDETAEALSITKGTCSLYLSVEAEMETQRVSEASTVREAWNFLTRKRQRLEDEHLEEFLSPSPLSPASPQAPAVAEALLNGGPTLPAAHFARPLRQESSVDMTIRKENFLQWAGTYSGPKFNLLHCDFPYGLSVENSQMMSSTAFKDGRGYQDKPADFEELLEVLFENFDRLSSVSCHLLFWFTSDPLALADLIGRFQKRIPSLRFWRDPLIWLKSCNTGIAADTRRGPRHIYESCLLASRGERLIVHTVGDAYAAPTDNKIHASCKPEPMLRHFMRMLVDESTSLLDPTCGSGSAIRAAESLGAKQTLGLEVQDELTLSARAELRKSRILRDTEKRLKKKPTEALAGL